MPARSEAGGLSRGFQPAIDYFRPKVNLPTRTWRDLQHGQHAKAFVVAGAMKEDLLTDLRVAADAAVIDGEGYDSFKRRFKDIVARHGWAHTGSAGWRSRVIWQTNVRVAFAAGRYKQMTDPAVLAHMPYWLYDHTTLLNPREQHRGWDGLVLLASDKFWDTNYPPNGWGCNCRVRPLSERQLRKLGKAGPDTAPAGAADAVAPEWRYNVGQAAHGLPPPLQAMRPAGDPGWRDMPHQGYTTWDVAGLAERLTARPLTTEPLRGVESTVGFKAKLVERWGADRKVFAVEGRDGFRYPLVADADELARHLSPDKRAFAGHMDDVLGDPDEVWLAFVRSTDTGKVALRARVIRAIKVGGGRVLLAVMEGQRGELVSWTLFPKDGLAQVNRLRQGQLVYAREAIANDRK